MNVKTHWIHLYSVLNVNSFLIKEIRRKKILLKDRWRHLMDVLSWNIIFDISKSSIRRNWHIQISDIFVKKSFAKLLLKRMIMGATQCRFVLRFIYSIILVYVVCLFAIIVYSVSACFGFHLFLNSNSWLFWVWIMIDFYFCWF